MANTRSQFRFAGDLLAGAGKIIRILEGKEHTLKAGEIAKLLGVTRQHIYKMAADGTIPSFQLGAAIRFDPEQVAEWLRRKMRQPVELGDTPRIAV